MNAGQCAYPYFYWWASELLPIFFFFNFWLLGIKLLKMFWTYHLVSICTLFSFLVVLGNEFRASLMLGKHSTTWATPPASHFLLLVYFSDRVFHFCLGPAILLLPSSWVAGVTGMCHHPSLYALTSFQLIPWMQLPLPWGRCGSFVICPCH
jgi:hypothetical protein